MIINISSAFLNYQNHIKGAFIISAFFYLPIMIIDINNSIFNKLLHQELFQQLQKSLTSVSTNCMPETLFYKHSKPF